ncbi:MAG: redoxin family protein [Phycisphaerales bacterium]|nr:redoxin family protein [Phycisphaerales bacterium]
MTSVHTRPRQLTLALHAILCLTLTPLIAQAQERPAEPPNDQAAQPPTSQPDTPAESQPTTQPTDTTPAGNVDPAAKEILQAMSDTIANASSIRASIKTTVTGSLASVTPSTDALVRLRKADSAWLIRVTGSGTRNGQDTNFDVAWGGGSITWLDHKEKKLVGRPQSEARGGPYSMASQALPTQFIESPPFTKELAGEEISHAGTEEFDAQNCDVLHVRYPKRKILLKLWIAQSDHMLRKLERSTETTKITSSTVQELRDVILNKDIPDAELTIAAPDGYSSDVTAPQRFEKARPTAPSAPNAGTHARDENAAPSQSPADTITPSGAERRDLPPTTTSPSTTLAPDSLPSVSLTLSDGSTLTTESLRGKPAVLMIWGTWNLPARDAIEPLSKFAASLKEPGVPVIACAVRERTKDAAAEFLKNFQPRNRTGDDKIDTSVFKVAGSADPLARELSITRYPTFLAIDAEGKIIKRLEGFDPVKTIDELRLAVAP